MYIGLSYMHGVLLPMALHDIMTYINYTPPEVYLR